VQSDIQVRIKAYSPTGNDAVTSSTVRVWATAGELHIVSPQATDIKVYTLTGILIINRPVLEGETVISLDKGLYIVKVGDTIRKITTLP
ncbi:MAG: DUF6383 domain-containing protein, partial [Tannerella sp.]|nr:DUF6383 domain-containing protein [Tannerella sp.]